MEQKAFFGPLTLHQKDEKLTIFKINPPQECYCVLCDNKYVLPESEQAMLTHFFMQHRLVIADVNQIADLKAYITYWRLRFQDESLPYFCTTMLLDDKPDGTKSKDEKYYLLSDVLPEDKQLRSNLQQTRLENLLKIHQFEREDKSFQRECLFCRHNTKDTRSNYLKHLFEKHNFHIARPENLILIDELIDTVAKKLEKLQCIYCEKFFKDRTILKEHMRKKGHKRINPDNKEYDKFFLVNYLGEKQYKNHKNNSQSDKKKTYDRESNIENNRADYDSNVDSDPDWSEWTEDNGPMIMCLFCDHSEMDYDCILDHMEKTHKFSFTEVTLGLDFYHKIKIVNFIRRQIHIKQCFNCDLKFEDIKNIEKHMRDSKHFDLSKSKWDQPEYYFPTYEDDLFLSFIQDQDESWWSGDEKEREEVILTDSISKEMAMAVLEDDT